MMPSFVSTVLGTGDILFGSSSGAGMILCAAAGARLYRAAFRLRSSGWMDCNHE
jgi:hypothetical protein